MKCRHCSAPLENVFLDLGFAPPSNAYLSKEDLSKPEIYYPLKVRVCEQCWLVQTEDFASAESLFNNDYAYFSSTSKSWLDHAAHYARDIIHRLNLGAKSFVIEVASNDGYLLKNFVNAGIPCLGIEPTASTAEAAKRLGIPVLSEFFSEELGQKIANENKMADLIIGNNVYAHVPDINDFTHGLKAALKPGGTITLEFPHIMRLIENTQFDTIYHEHFSYFSLYTVIRIFKRAGLKIIHVEELVTHGGSIRVYGSHEDDVRSPTHSVNSLLKKERNNGLQKIETYMQFQSKADRIKNNLSVFLIQQKSADKSVIAYGAAAKGNTLLNYAGIKPDLLQFVCDAAEAKQGKYMPGSHIPIISPAALTQMAPDYLLILPWNIASEIKNQNAFLRNKGTKFITVVPKMVIE